MFAFRDSNRISIIDSAGGGTTPGTGREVAALLISSKAGTPRQAAQVANDLAASLIAQDREERTRGTEEALTFLNGEAGRLSRQLARVDAQIGEVKNANEESLPEAASKEEMALVMAKAVARRVVTDWEGVGDANGKSVPVTPEGGSRGRARRAPSSPPAPSSPRRRRPP